MFPKIGLVALAGALGTIARYGLTGVVHRINGASFPWGTLAVNVTGCFLAGFLWALFQNRWPVSGETRMIVLVGFTGAFTTFSTYILESGELVRSAEWMYSIFNVASHNILGFVALFVGLAAGSMF